MLYDRRTMPESALTRRERPRVTILDERFDVVLADARCEFAAEIFRETARGIVERGAESAEIDADGKRYVVHVARLAGAGELRYAVFVEQRGVRRPLMDAYDRFGLSPREVEVLALIIDGASNREIADALCIVESTVQDHVRSLCAKTGSRGRGALLARVFDVAGDGGPS
jgi:DNA-binding CsgD family transcriptional regulator